jgi:hypothetical protein
VRGAHSFEIVVDDGVVLTSVNAHPGGDVCADGRSGIRAAPSKDLLDDLVELEDVPTMAGS